MITFDFFIGVMPTHVQGTQDHFRWYSGVTRPIPGDLRGPRATSGGAQGSPGLYLVVFRIPESFPVVLRRFRPFPVMLGHPKATSGAAQETQGHFWWCLGSPAYTWRCLGKPDTWRVESRNSGAPFSYSDALPMFPSARSSIFSSSV